MPWGSFKAWYGVHRWTSLACTLSLLLLCLTGAPLVLKEEIGVWSGSTVEPPDMPGVTTRVSIDGLIADARRRRPGDEVRYVSQSDDAPAWFVAMGRTADAAEATAVYKYDARTGAMIHDVTQGGKVMRAIRSLHVDLFAGLPGTLFIGLMGLMFVASTLSGLMVYRFHWQAVPFGTIRRNKSARLFWLDWHNLLGMMTLAWLILVGVTGVINTLALPLLGYWQAHELPAMTQAWRGPAAAIDSGSAQRAMEAARAAMPGMEVDFLGMPGSRFATPRHYMVFMHGDTFWTSRILQPVMVQADNAEVVSTRALPWYLVALLVCQPLHFGDFGGMPLKILWICLDLGTIGLLLSGLYLWRRRKAKA
ncbi:MAG TPA: PepSY-associated TM helix domain-containing protein [Bordetella sp.]